MFIKYFLILLVSLFSVSLSADDACHDEKDKSSRMSASLSQSENSIEIQVSGMTCAGCVMKLEQEVAKIDKSEGVVIIVEKNLVKVDYSKANLTDSQLATLKTKVEEAVKAAKFTLS